MIGRDYGMVENGDSIAEYVKHIDNVIQRFKFDTNKFKEDIIRIFMDSVKIELSLKS